MRAAAIFGFCVFVVACGGSEEPAGRIAFTSDRDGGYHLYVMNTDGTNLVQITDETVSGGSVWAPDAKRVAFELRGDIYVVEADGSKLVQLTEHSGFDTFLRGHLTASASPFNLTETAISSYTLLMMMGLG